MNFIEFYTTLISLKPVPEGPTDTCIDSVNSSVREARKPLPEPMMTLFIDASIRGETIRYCHDMIPISIQVSRYKLWYNIYMLFLNIFKFLNSKLWYDIYMLFFNKFKLLNSNLRITEYIIRDDMYLHQFFCIMIHILMIVSRYIVIHGISFHP